MQENAVYRLSARFGQADLKAARRIFVAPRATANYPTVHRSPISAIMLLVGTGEVRALDAALASGSACQKALGSRSRADWLSDSGWVFRTAPKAARRPQTSR
jgi:hypothetical protein